MGCGHGLQSFGGGIALAFVVMRHSFAFFSTWNFSKVSTRRLKQCVFSARRESASTKKLDCVYRSMRRKKTTFNALFLAIDVSIVSMY